MKRVLSLALVAAVTASVAFLVLVPRRLSSLRTPIAATPVELGMAFEAVEFPAPDAPLVLRAWWIPAVETRAAIVMVHGHGDNKSHPHTGWLGLARALVGRGYGVLDLDLRNHGESDDSPRVPTLGPQEANDVVAAVDFLAAREPGIRFGAIGYSMGGQIVLYAAARDPRIEAVVSDATYAEVRPIVPLFAHAVTGLPALLFSGPFLWSAERLHGLRLERARAVEVIASIAPRPILLVHDRDDPVVPVEHALRLADAARSEELWITTAPARSADFVRRQGRWGTHAQSFALHRDEYVARVTRLFDRMFATAAAGVTAGTNDAERRR